jgi:8-oxo-dGTP pyrophosphatase MutT (NUDIX family)
VRLAATVMVVRPAGARFEVFMLRRSERSHFVPDAFVFPGGTVGESDLSERALARLYDGASTVAAQFRARPAAGSTVPIATQHEASGLLFAALRELFEEAGIAYACSAAGETRALGDTRSDFLQLLEAQDAYADSRALTLFSQWLTPAQFPKRYNTHFFLAELPHGIAASADAFETHDGQWFDPDEALARNAAGDLHLVYPTIKHLERLASFANTADLLAFARAKPIRALTPDTVEDGFALPSALENAW